MLWLTRLFYAQRKVEGRAAFGASLSNARLGGFAGLKVKN